MTIFLSLDIGVSGMQTQSHNLDIISHNIANLDTTGYKSTRAQFANLVASPLVNTVDTGGVRNKDAQVINQQGQILPASAATNLAIAGDGFFAVKQEASGSDSLLYTRAGAFMPDENGDLRNGAGFYLQGWRLNADGTLPSSSEGTLATINIQQFDQLAVPTGQMALHLNLYSSQVAYTGSPAYNAADPAANMASGAIPPHFSQPLTIIDSTGIAHTVMAGFIKTAANNWAVELYSTSPAEISGGNAQITSGTLTFNGDGSLSSVSTSLTQLPSIAWTNGAAASNITLDWGTAGPIFGTPGATIVGNTDGLSQYASDYNIGAITQDGIQPGTLKSLSVSSDGYLFSTYNNGATQRLYMIPLAKLINPNQLIPLSGTVFGLSSQNSIPQYLQPGEEGAGILQSNALEHSTADEAKEITNMIIAQRSYKFNSDVISRSNDMLQTLTEMVI